MRYDHIIVAYTSHLRKIANNQPNTMMTTLSSILRQQQNNNGRVINRILLTTTTRAISTITSTAGEYNNTLRTKKHYTANNNSAKTTNVRLRSFSAVAAIQPQPQSYNDDITPDYSHLYNTTTTYHPLTPEPNYTELGLSATSKINLFTAINSAMRTAMQTDDTAIVFGEDVSFGGVFRCAQNLREEFGEERVFNTPLSENGIAVCLYVVLYCMHMIIFPFLCILISYGSSIFALLLPLLIPGNGNWICLGRWDSHW